MITYVLDEAGNPQPEPDPEAWGRWFGENERHIADDTIDGVRISTVFIGIDHAIGRGPPLLYETMIFGGAFDGNVARYATREEAVAGHARAVRRVLRDVRGV